MDYRIGKKRKIVYCILDKIKSYKGSSSGEIARNISDFFLSFLIDREYDIIINNNSDDLIRRAASDDFYSHAVIIITGTHTGLSDRLFDAVERKCTENFTVAGHILDRDSAYYEIHNQFFIINLEEYRRIGFPDMGEEDWYADHIKIEPIRSMDLLYNDSEITNWIISGTVERTYSQKRHGWNFIDIGLKNGAIFCDIGKEIRDNKKYLYYEYDHVFFKHLPLLFEYKLVCNNIVSPWNSDLLAKQIVKLDNSIDHYITTGTGLNWIYNLSRFGYNEKSRVTFIDISYVVLSFMKSLIEEWDGTDYANFYIQQLKIIPNNYNLDLDSHESRMREWFENFKKEFDNFEDTWNDIKKLKYNFELIDFFSTINFNFITSGENTFINVSDAFNHVPYIPQVSVKYRVARENNLVNNLTEIDPNILLHIPARTGQIYKENLAENEKIYFGKVSDFNLWDINEFTCPPWQEENWKSLCPMTGNKRILT